MKTVLASAAIFVLFAPVVSAQQVVLQRGMPQQTVEILLATDDLGLTSGIGNTTRQADHATVAMNEDLDIAVAFHSDRDDIANGLKQVEVAYFEYLPASDTWEHVETRLVGGIDYNPIGLLPQPIVKCERPDVIAVGKRFFVTWTRRYDDSFGGPGGLQQHQPAVLECAWIGRGTGSSIEVIGVPGSPGLGFELQAHVVGGAPSELFEVLDCAGVADAVPLKDSSLPPGTLKAGVAYPHQTLFTNSQSQDRRFTMRFVTCTFDTTTGTVASVAPVELRANIPFDGPTGLGGGSTAGLILPDLAPSSEDNAFWLAGEAQVMTPPAPGATPLPDGIVKLQYWKLLGAGNWSLLAGRTYVSDLSLGVQSRRRPMVSSYPAAILNEGPETVSIVFNVAESDPTYPNQSIDLLHEECEYQAGSIFSPSPPVLTPWANNSSVNDAKPVPLRGNDSPAIRRCYAGRSPTGSSAPSEIISFDAVGNVYTSLETQTQPGSRLSRPAVAYRYDTSVPVSDNTAVAFEKKNAAGDLRIWLGIE